MSRWSFDFSKRNAYRDRQGNILVAGLDGRHSTIDPATWDQGNRFFDIHPDIMFNVAGMAMEEGEIRRLLISLSCLDDTSLATLDDIFENACGTIDPRTFIRNALRNNENTKLYAILERQRLLDHEGFFKPQVEYLLLSQKFPEFFAQRSIRDHASHNGFTWTSRATEVFQAANSGRKSVRSEDCSPWTVLATANLIGPQDDSKPVSLLGLYL